MTKMEMFQVLVIVATLMNFIGSADACPTGCTCDTTAFRVACSVGNFTDLERIAQEIAGDTKELVLKGTNLVKFDASFNLTNLEKLDLSKNLLETVPRNLSIMFPKLDVLDLGGNQINEISSDDFEGLSNLAKLVLSENKLTSLKDGSFKNLIDLKQLLLKHNNVSSISKDAFQGLSNLTNLVLTENRVANLLPGVFDYFTRPQLTLEFSKNLLQEIPNGLFLKLKEMQQFGLASNKISKIGSEAFQNVKITQLLNLMNNSLENLSDEQFKNSSIFLAVFNDNPVKCSCSLRNLVTKFGRLMGKCSESGTNVTHDFAGLKGLSPSARSEALCTQCDLNNTCVNGGICIPLGKFDFNCTCTGGYYGQNCENVPICQSDHCHHHGQCIPVGESDYKCDCSEDYEGKNCELLKKDTGLSGGEIAGIVLGILLLVVLIIVVVLCRGRFCPCCSGDGKDGTTAELKGLKPNENV